jgi:MFS family permease
LHDDPVPTSADHALTSRLAQRLGFPAVGEHRRFVTAIGIDAVGSGIWMPVSMIFFLATTHLSLVQVGLALSLASLLSLPAAVLAGQLVDRYGSKNVLQVGNALQAVSFLAYPFADAVWSVALVVAVSVVGRTAFWGSYSPMVTLISPPGEREKWFGFLGALRNAGFAIGGVVAGAALTLDTASLYYAVALLNAASYVLSFVLLAGVGVDEPRRPHAHGDAHEVVGGWREVLADRGYRWLVASNLGYAMTSAALNVAIPVYVVEMLSLPGWVSAAVFVINTVLIGLCQGLVVQRMTGAVRARIVALGAALTAASFLVLWGASPLGVVAACTVVLVAAVVYTLGELVAGPVLTTIAAESPPPALRGRYLATYQLSWNVATGVAPILYAWLLDLGSGPAWLGLTAIALLGGLATVPMRRGLPHAAQVVTNRAEPLAA